MLDILHDAVHIVSHFQIDVSDADADLAELVSGGTLVTFAERALKVATAWDDNASSDPHVRIVVSVARGAFTPSDTFGGLIPIASAPIRIGAKGLVAGNHITGDVAAVSVPEGTYTALVLLDRIEPMTARSVHICLLPQISSSF